MGRKRIRKETLTLGDKIQGVIKNKVLCSSIIEINKVKMLSVGGTKVNTTREIVGGYLVLA